jgi:hypothetical protein
MSAARAMRTKVVHARGREGWMATGQVCVAEPPSWTNAELTPPLNCYSL